ncbi:LADA_0D13278g1_1 [Lachancea dasiensis]|uniref:LADA_0D13278g1_1 n=1 Tax=Lachancea dasiensis TaxID=1072105 RepID=A0A1G4J8H7_9SACH|nr:LADA_0D13278g1_1 [Lachancea dasiensis]
MLKSFSESYVSPQDHADTKAIDNNFLFSYLHSQLKDDEIESLLNQYWNIFDPVFPLIHKPTFNYKSASCTLVSAMCTVAMLYRSDLKNFSGILCENTLNAINEPLFCANASIQTVQAALILVFYGTFTDKVWYQRCRALHSQIVAVARETGIFQTNPRDQCDDEWKSFIVSEERKRVSFCLYMIDSQMATLLNYPPSLSHYEIKHPLPCSDTLWQLENALLWKEKHTLELSNGERTSFLDALQQALIFGKTPKNISSFGSLSILLPIHIMIRNMEQYAGVLEVPKIKANDPFSRKSQLGTALNALRSLIPKRGLRKGPKKSHDMWDMFVATWNLAYIHLHVPDPIITSGIVEVTLRATIATAAVLAKPSEWYPPGGTSVSSNNMHLISSHSLSVMVSHICYFLKFADFLKADGGQERSPVFTFMFYKAGLVAWQILHIGLSGRKLESTQDGTKPVDEEYIMRRLVDDIMSFVEVDDPSEVHDSDELKVFEKWMRTVLVTADTWSVGAGASASFFF